MCHRSVGLIQNYIEGAGISTVSVTMRPEITRATKVPRAAYLRFPLGNPLGEAKKPEQQRLILRDLLRVAEESDRAGGIVALPHRWRRMEA